MGQKVNPIGMRLQVNRTWDSRWYADTKEYGDLLLEDLRMREFIREEAKQAGVSKIIIERPHRKCRVTIHTARPGVIIGKKGADIETLRKKLAAMTASELHLNIVEVRKPELDAQLVAESIAQQLERRVSFRRAMKRAVQNAMRMGALGIRVNVAGRLGGAEIARTEWYREGRVPLHTLRADIDYALAEATTPYGIIGVKVWIFKGEILEHDPSARDRRQQELQDGPAPRGAGGGGAATATATAKESRRCCNQSARNSANSTRAASTARPRAGPSSTSASSA